MSLVVLSLDELEHVHGAQGRSLLRRAWDLDYERALVAGAQWAPVGTAAGGALGVPVGAAVGGLATSPALGVGAIPGALWGSFLGGAVGTAVGWTYGLGKDIKAQWNAQPEAAGQ